MKRRRYSFLLVEILVSITLIGMIFSIVGNSIYRYAKRDSIQAKIIKFTHEAINQAAFFEINLLPELKFDKIPYLSQSKWKKMARKKGWYEKWGFLKNQETILQDGTRYEILVYKLKSKKLKKEHSQYFIVKKRGEKMEEANAPFIAHE